MTLRCPTTEEVAAQAIALLPRGRAWQTDESGPRPGTVLYGYWCAIADPIAFATRRLCDLYREFFCATQSETRAEWLLDYGLPDPCDPYPDLCAKVAAFGGARCEDYIALAAANGWDIDCDDGLDGCGDQLGFTSAGSLMVGGSAPNATLRIRVYPLTSPSFVGAVLTAPQTGALQTGTALACPPDISRLICLLDRVIQAHVLTTYFVAEPRTTLTDAPIRADSGNPTDGAVR